MKVCFRFVIFVVMFVIVCLRDLIFFFKLDLFFDGMLIVILFFFFKGDIIVLFFFSKLIFFDVLWLDFIVLDLCGLLILC